jgi:ubiquinone/menaquinone biosynthesis C-methylase UbiE
VLTLKELNRILKKEGRLVIDMPNEKHPDINTMVEYESYLGRTRRRIIPKEEFENELTKFFMIDKIENTQIMIQYFVRKKS